MSRHPFIIDVEDGQVVIRLNGRTLCHLTDQEASAYIDDLTDATESLDVWEPYDCADPEEVRL